MYYVCVTILVKTENYLAVISKLAGKEKFVENLLENS